MKTACIYHSIDLDGWMSAAIVKHWFNKQEVPNKEGEYCNTINFIGYNYGQSIPDLSEYDKVIMCDISFSIEEMENLRQHLQDNFIWIDHHISAIKAADERANNYYDGIRDTKFAACELTWKYFFPNEPMPEIVRLLGLYDSFRHKNTDEETKVLEFQYGARQCISNYEEAYDYLLKSFEGIIEYDYVGRYTIENIIHNSGRIIYQYLCTEAKQTYKNGFEIQFYWAEDIGRPNGVPKQCAAKFICINKERFNPINFGIDYHKDGYDGAACFYLNKDKKWSFSLYNDNGEVDCSAIAKQYGGGGHFSASGFRCDSNTFLKIINNG